MVKNSIAVALTVKNEERFLPEFFLYHHALGIDRFYVLLHDCTDRSEAICNGLPFVKPFLGTHLEDHPPAFCEQMMDGFTQHALYLARLDKIDWLLCIDADEFIHPFDDLTQRPHVGALKELVRNVSESIALIFFPVVELLPCINQKDRPFYESTDFLQDQSLKRIIPHPFTGESREFNGFLGHRSGKSMVRTTAPLQAYGSHQFARHPAPGQAAPKPRPTSRLHLPSMRAGRLLHHNIVNAKHWQEKYGKHSTFPPQYQSGRPVQYHKQLWKEIAPLLSEEACLEYFENSIAVSPETIQTLYANGAAISCPSIRDLLFQTGNLCKGEELRRQITSPASDSLGYFPIGNPSPDGIPAILDLTLFEFPLESVNRSEEENVRSGIEQWEYWEGRFFAWTTSRFQFETPKSCAGRGLLLDIGPLAHLVKAECISCEWHGVPFVIQREAEESSFFLGTLPFPDPANEEAVLRCSVAVIVKEPHSQDPRELGLPIFAFVAYEKDGKAPREILDLVRHDRALTAEITWRRPSLALPVKMDPYRPIFIMEIPPEKRAFRLLFNNQAVRLYPLSQNGLLAGEVLSTLADQTLLRLQERREDRWHDVNEGTVTLTSQDSLMAYGAPDTTTAPQLEQRPTG